MGKTNLAVNLGNSKKKKTQLYCIISLKIRHKKNLSNNERFFVGLQGIDLEYLIKPKYTSNTCKI